MLCALLKAFYLHFSLCCLPPSLEYVCAFSQPVTPLHSPPPYPFLRFHTDEYELICLSITLHKFTTNVNSSSISLATNLSLSYWTVDIYNCRMYQNVIVDYKRHLWTIRLHCWMLLPWFERLMSMAPRYK